jgi:hypothetical protein
VGPISGEIVPEVFKIGPFPALDQRQGRFAVEVEMPEVAHQPDAFPIADTRQESVHQDNDRIRSQHGQFTFHGESELPLEELAPDCVRKVVVPTELAKVLRKRIKGDFNDYSLFPDLDAVGRFLQKRYGLRG